MPAVPSLEYPHPYRSTVALAVADRYPAVSPISGIERLCVRETMGGLALADMRSEFVHWPGRARLAEARLF